MKKVLSYLEQHPLTRFLIVLSAFVGLIVSAPTIYYWFVNKKSENINNETISRSSQNLTEYFTPTHRIKYIVNSNLVQVRNRPLTQLEIKQLKYETNESQTIEANTIIGQINCQTRLRILKHDSSFIRIQYFDGINTMIGYIPDSVALTLIQPDKNNRYGLGNASITIYTNNETGVNQIFLMTNT